MISSKIFVVFIFAFVAFAFCWEDDFFDENKLRCKCELQPKMMKCRTNATDSDLCFQCATTCGRQVTRVYFHNGSQCMADKLKTCCPLVTEVEIDAQFMCDCYCKVGKSINISSSDPKKIPIDCKCPPSSLDTESAYYLIRYGNFCNASVLLFCAILLLIIIFTVFQRNFMHGLRSYYTQPQREKELKLIDGEENPCFQK